MTPAFFPINARHRLKPRWLVTFLYSAAALPVEGTCGRPACVAIGPAITMALPLPWQGPTKAMIRCASLRILCQSPEGRCGGSNARCLMVVPQTARRAFGSFSHDCFSYFPFIARLKSARIALSLIIFHYR